ncbi:BlaI/MecI/CopY family transcriptional regulator [Corallococcus exiguus]|uniref:BlaI/MecI/CopY family transcriptional regulator n=1 Tax=Corallococcus exiguus TaxID=83462 RepID=UPI001A8ECA4F|nr:BlaI/MecI/CopY family transcriptional regulator [Corallococcus exiguus]MBN8465227.1 BlaI/MecI/CopY family transcriptional regulator [Corallococcus exiguus]
MAPKIPLPGGELELAALGVLWQLGTATARDIHERMGAPTGLAYTTTATVLGRLFAKRLVGRKRQGKAFVYRARVSQEAVGRERAQQQVARLLGQEPLSAIATLVDAVESVDPELLEELARVVNARRRKNRGP